MRLLRGGSLVLLAALAAAASGASASGVARAHNGLIVYASFRAVDSTGEQIYAIEPNGTGDRRLLHTKNDDWGPRWSPDGRSIAFTEDDANNPLVSSVFVMTASGGSLRRVTDPKLDAFSPSWSPDGRRLVAAADAGLTIVDLRTGARKTLPADGGAPAWSPNGRWIAFVIRHRGKGQIYRIRPDGSGLRRMTKNSKLDYGRPSWAPDSMRLVADLASRTSEGLHVPDLVVVRLDGRQRILRTLANADDPAWSPDGKRIVFGADPAPRESDYDIYSMKVSGRGVRAVTTDGGGSGWPDWQPVR